MEYAIVIGIDHYDQRPLKGAVADAEAFAKFLTDKKLISDSNQNLKLFKSDVANTVVLGPEIDKAIEDIVKDAKKRKNENNRLYFYFSGHGIGNTFINTALCMRYWSSVYINHCISSLKYTTGIINKGAFDEVLIFLDCCREHDTTIEGLPPIGDWQNKVGDRNPKLFVCNSTIYGKLSYEIDIDSNKKRGAFTSFLIDSLNGDADINGNGKVTALDLKKHIDDNFLSYAQRFNKIQQGTVFTDTGGDSIIICEVEQLTAEYNYEIIFKRNSNVSLLTHQFAELYRANVKVGDKWHKKLGRGTFLLKDNNNNEPPKAIFNYSENTMSYDEF
ncbi:caspase family protein [Epilithonimonas mollis]|uniref:Caspase domain-containing protein n=1 Tax=Epilithonimonas mollis TaxID=216903 RepID=A0A1M6U5H0_9FLAO|nr:caspase family protein [Epilithonimonas mollis]SHK64437.1 Caspase domain-containing protein [Epilithonimonas mollis]